eukprot:7343659-Prymnesium_polylepis.2
MISGTPHVTTIPMACFATTSSVNAMAVKPPHALPTMLNCEIAMPDLHTLVKKRPSRQAEPAITRRPGASDGSARSPKATSAAPASSPAGATRRTHRADLSHRAPHTTGMMTPITMGATVSRAYVTGPRPIDSSAGSAGASDSFPA